MWSQDAGGRHPCSEGGGHRGGDLHSVGDHRTAGGHSCIHPGACPNVQTAVLKDDWAEVLRQYVSQVRSVVGRFPSSFRAWSPVLSDRCARGCVSVHDRTPRTWPDSCPGVDEYGVRRLDTAQRSKDNITSRWARTSNLWNKIV